MKPLPEKLVPQTRELIADLRSDAGLPSRAAAWLLEQDARGSRHPGLLHYLGWTVMARYAEHLRRWLSWLAVILHAFDFFRADVAQLVGAIVEPGVRSAKRWTIIAWRFWLSKEKMHCESIIASVVAAISKLTVERGMKACCWPTGLHFTST
ncbi:MAG TPA: hypothetical protein VEK33_02730 [Terriglobales bacterium]|nr:hypothetical protein [Terriglobales bacterium]